MIEFYQALYAFFGSCTKTAGARPFMPRSQEFSCKEMVVYVRATPRFNPETYVYEKALVIARVDVQPEFRGQKIFRDFVKHMEAQAHAHGYAAIYVDQVHSDVLKECLPRYGFVRQTNTDPGEYIYRKTVHSESPEIPVPEQVEENLYMIRENRSMEYVAFIARGEIGSTKDGRKAMHFRSEEIANHQALVLTRQSVEQRVYQVIISQTAALP
jgi:GNAT superfamily N-acetyltransferase|uniref:Acetyltransferase n=1 Tax=Myoviridae sp. ctshb19 TaxID=2825194 RepID=A0A8S5UGA8_9CAUD|nr:MAG TPA: acetyltransferase [Myoviridae sp. ctshb19]